jgi:acetoin utilization deacetylase AcuC-like enzyme
VGRTKDLVDRAPVVRRLLDAHDGDYLDAILCGVPSSLAESQGFAWDEGLPKAVFASTGGVRDAARRALELREHSGSLSSGLHHARRDIGAGFCTINGLAVAALDAVQRGAQRVLILDLDAHCGGGTASIIDGHPGIEQVDVSVSSFDRYGPTEQARLVLSGGNVDPDLFSRIIRGEI